MDCPFCKEEILEDAVKCKHCGSMLQEKCNTHFKKSNRISPAFIILAGIAVGAIVLYFGGFIDFSPLHYEVVKNGHLAYFGDEISVGALFQNLADGPVIWSASKIVSPEDFKKSHYLVEARFSVLKSLLEKENILNLLGVKKIVLNVQFLVEKNSIEFQLYSGTLNDINNSGEEMLKLLRDLNILVNMEKEETAKKVENRDNYKKAILEMHNIVTGIEGYRADHGFPPKTLSLLVPEYLSSFSSNDPWGKAYIYGTNGKNAGLASCGSDGEFLGFNQKGTYEAPDSGEDIIFVDGAMSYRPLAQGEEPQKIEKVNQIVNPNFLITNGTVFGLFPGMSLEEMEKVVGKDNIIIKKEVEEVEGGQSELIRVEIILPFEDNPRLTSVLDENNHIYGLGINDNRFFTAENISTTSTIGEIRKAYPDLSIKWGEGYGVRSEQAHMAFHLVDPGTMPDDSSVISSMTLLRKD